MLKRIAIVITVIVCCSIKPMAQYQVNYNLFNRTPLGQINIETPRPAQIQSVDINRFSQPGNRQIQPFATDPMLDLNSQREQQNKQIMQEVDMYEKRQQALADAQKDIMEMGYHATNRNYQTAFIELNKMKLDSFQLTKAVYIVENAYLDNQLPFDKFNNGINKRASLVKQILKREGLSNKNNDALNYGIQKIFSSINLYYDTESKTTIQVPPFKYDFEDFMGEKDYTKMFVSKLMATGKGQCHSMPLMYLLVAEHLGAKAYLSYAPEHTFIQFINKEGKMIDFETTNGKLVSSTCMTQSGYITSQALMNQTYLHPLSKRQLYAQVLADLLLGYLSKMPYDDFAEQVRRRVLDIEPNNLTALLVDANVKTKIATQKISEAGKPKAEDLPKYPEAYKAYQAISVAYERVDATGFQDMPKDAYQRWLASIDKEKKKQEVVTKGNVKKR